MGSKELSSYDDMIFEAILEDGVFRFDCSIDAQAAAFPSLSFVDPQTREIPVSSSQIPKYVPSFVNTGQKQDVIIKVEFLNGISDFI